MRIAGKAIEPGSGHREGRLLLAQLYKEETGKPLPEIRTTPEGKPYFPDSPLHFSITHTRSHVFCALSERPIGIDAEEAHRDISLKLADKILSPGEYAQFQSAPDPRLALLTFWVLKEADSKRTGLGLRGYPNHTDFSLDDPRVRFYDGCLLAVIEEETYAL